jgi:hypothetical protein
MGVTAGTTQGLECLRYAPPSSPPASRAGRSDPVGQSGRDVTWLRVLTYATVVRHALSDGGASTRAMSMQNLVLEVCVDSVQSAVRLVLPFRISPD